MAISVFNAKGEEIERCIGMWPVDGSTKTALVFVDDLAGGYSHSSVCMMPTNEVVTEKSDDGSYVEFRIWKTKNVVNNVFV